MAAFNAGDTIGQAINSVITQTFHDWELLVVNDCSQDHTEKIVQQYMKVDTRIQIINNVRNCGVSLSRKKALEQAKGEWIAILDSDDIWKPDKLEKQILLALQKDASLIYTGSAFIDNEGNSINWQLNVPLSLTYKELLKQNLISNSSALVKTVLYKKYYASGDDMHEDYAMWLVITKAGYKAYGIDEPLLIYRLAKNSKSSNKLKAALMNWNTYRYVGLNLTSTIFYMLFYIKKSLFKYAMLKVSSFMGGL